MTEANDAFPLDDMIEEIKNYDVHHHRMSNVMAGSILRVLEYLKCKQEEPPLGEPPEYIPLSFHQLSSMIGEPVFVKPSGSYGYWSIVYAVKKDHTGEYVMFKEWKDDWRRITDDIFRTKEGANL